MLAHYKMQSNIPYPTDLHTIPTIHTVPHPPHTTGGEGGLERWTIYLCVHVYIYIYTVYIYIWKNYEKRWEHKVNPL